MNMICIMLSYHPYSFQEFRRQPQHRVKRIRKLHRPCTLKIRKIANDTTHVNTKSVANKASK